MKLLQTYYQDERGDSIEKGKIDCVGTYESSCDGFFTWDCGRCGASTSTRAYRIMGIVFQCPGCKTLNLLLRTDTNNIYQMVSYLEGKAPDRRKLFQDLTRSLADMQRAISNFDW